VLKGRRLALATETALMFVALALLVPALFGALNH